MSMMNNSEVSHIVDGNVGIAEAGVSTPSNGNSCNYWQIECPSLAKQNEYLLKFGAHSDCAFIVGKEDGLQERFECHKLLLAKASSVFEAMLYRPLTQDKGDISIKNMEPHIFEIILKFIYTGEYDLSDLETAFKVAQCSDFYMLPVLQNKAYENVLLKLNVKTAVLAWELAASGKTKVAIKVEQRAMKMILLHTDEILASESFLSAQHYTILNIAQQVALHATELQIISACENWLEKEAKRQGIKETHPQSLRKILGEVFSNLRFLTLTEKDTEFIQNTKLLTKSEKNKLLDRIKCNEKNDTWFFKGFSELDSNRIYLKLEVIAPIFTTENHITNYNTSCPDHIYTTAGGFMEMEFKVDHDIILLGFNAVKKWRSPMWEFKLKNENGVQLDVGNINGTLNLRFELPVVITKHHVHYLTCKIKYGEKCDLHNDMKPSDFKEEKFDFPFSSFCKTLVYAII